MPVAAAQRGRGAGTGMTEEVVDLGMGKEKALSVVHASKTLLLPLLFPRRSVTLFDEIALALSG